MMELSEVKPKNTYTIPVFNTRNKRAKLFSLNLRLKNHKIELRKKFSSRANDLNLINQIPNYKGLFFNNAQVDFLGCKENYDFMPIKRQNTLIQQGVNHEVPINEEYFEYMDILHSVANSVDTYTFIEVGAGYGRWSVRAFKAAQHFGYAAGDVKLVTVEPERNHAAWLLKHMASNNIPETSLEHYEMAVSNYEGYAPFFISRPNQVPTQESREWYGQALVKTGWDGARQAEVRVGKLSSIIEGQAGVVDLIDFDIQGEEPIVLEEIESVLKGVKMVHIGTNSESDEAFIRKFFKKVGWIKVRDIKGRGIRKTYVGRISFVDGVQTHINPKYLSLG